MSCEWLLLAALVLLAGGCANLPRIDPSGERFFLPPGAQPTVPPPPPALGYPGVAVNPSQIVAPVGSEVVLIASVVGRDGQLRSRQRVDWMLTPDSVGQIYQPGQRRCFEILQLFNGVPVKVNNQYAVNATLVVPLVLDRGTPTPHDDIYINDGQSWISLVSGVEGTSNVTVFSPFSSEWERRQQTATVYWIDAQWRFPPPAIANGDRHTLSTAISRLTNGLPVAGWTVRYSIAGGPGGGFAPDNTAQVDAITNEAGEASVELLQPSLAGTTQIGIQVLRPAGAGPEVPVGAGSTLVTWPTGDPSAIAPISPTLTAPLTPDTAPRGAIPPSSPPASASSLLVRLSGPQQAAVGSMVTYRIQVTNNAAAPATRVMVSDEAPMEFAFVNSHPASEPSSRGQQWELGDLPPFGSRSIDVNYRVNEAGNFNYCVTASATGVQDARECVATRTLAPQLEVTANGPPTAPVGSTVRYDILIVNRSPLPATDLAARIEFDAGLQHAQFASPLEQTLGDLAPGQSRQLGINYRVTQPGELCQEITISGAGGLSATTRKCLTATGGDMRQPTPAPNTPLATGAAARLEVSLEGSSRKRVGETDKFVIVVTNTGTQPITDLEIAGNFDRSLLVKAASEGWSWKGDSLVWTVPNLPPGGREPRAVAFECVLDNPRACNRMMISAPGLESISKELCLEISDAQQPPPAAPPPVETTPGGTVEVTISELTTAGSVGNEGRYQIVIENRGEQPQYNVALIVNYSENLRFEGSEGPERGTPLPGTLRYNALRELRPGEAVSFELRMKATKEGPARIHADVATGGQSRPVAAEKTFEIAP